MEKGYGHRIYNLVFCIFFVTTLYFSYRAVRRCLEDYIAAGTTEYYDIYRQAHSARHQELIRQGKQQEAEAYGELADHFILTELPITADVSADPAAQKIKWMEFRVRLVRRFKSPISLLTPPVLYLGLYFLVWKLGSLSARYIKGIAPTQPTN